MKSIVKTIKSPQKYIYKQFYSTSSNKPARMELTDIPTEDEIDFEVSQDLEQISSK